MEYFDYKYRVIYGDTDKMGVTYYGNYLRYFEAARTEYFRALGLPYTECEKRGLYLPVVDAGISYRGTSTYDDLLIVRTSVSEFGRSKIRFEYQIFKKDSPARIITTGYTVHVFVDQNIRPTEAPDDVRDRVTCHTLLPVSKK